MLRGLDDPWAACMASSSAHLFEGKLEWPGVQWICKSMTFLVGRWRVIVLVSWYWAVCNCSAALCTWSSRW